jgi:hypothetical protein
MTTNRAIVLSLVLAATALAPATALAKHGADDPAGDDRGGQTTATDDNPSTSGDSRSGSNSGRSEDKPKRAKKLVRVAGECTGDSTSKLKVKRDRGRLKTEFEVDENVAGVTWAVQLSRNGTVAVDTTRTTRAPSGSFRIERRLANGAGPDTISAKATSPTGEVCTARATL